jgi:hypothetical protein
MRQVWSCRWRRLTHLVGAGAPGGCRHLGGAESPARALDARVPRSQQSSGRASSRAGAHRRGEEPPAGICPDPLAVNTQCRAVSTVAISRLGGTQIRRELELGARSGPGPSRSLEARACPGPRPGGWRLGVMAKRSQSQGSGSGVTKCGGLFPAGSWLSRGPSAGE